MNYLSDVSTIKIIQERENRIVSKNEVNEIGEQVYTFDDGLVV